MSIDWSKMETAEQKFLKRKEQKYQSIASDRYNFEISGLAFGDNVIKTDRESVALLKGAYDEAVNNPEYNVNWKGENGFITLNAEQIKTIYQKVKAHVQSAFDTEMMLDEQIDEATNDEELDKIVWIDPNK